MRGYRISVETDAVHFLDPRRCNDDDCRPVVVIDPEDREQVERLRNALPQHAFLSKCDPEPVAAALRSLLAPPKPDEPQGLGAVVEDAKGIRWLRGPGYNSWQWICVDTPGAEAWRDIAAVKVLSEGVTA